MEESKAGNHVRAENDRETADDFSEPNINGGVGQFNGHNGYRHTFNHHDGNGHSMQQGSGLRSRSLTEVQKSIYSTVHPQKIQYFHATSLPLITQYRCKGPVVSIVICPQTSLRIF